VGSIDPGNLVRVSGELELSEFELSRFYCMSYNFLSQSVVQRKDGPARRVIPLSKKAEPSVCFLPKRFAKFCKEM